MKAFRQDIVHLARGAGSAGFTARLAGPNPRRRGSPSGCPALAGFW